MSTAQVAEARTLHEDLVMRHMRVPNDFESGMRALEPLYGLAYWPQHDLRYKRRTSDRFIRKIKETYYTVLANSARKDLTKLRHMAAIEAKKGHANARLESLKIEAQQLLAALDALAQEMDKA